jgi:hypothetical protein
MMQQANTLQFRNTVRKVLAKYGITIWDSYTNKSTAKGRRTVGFRVGFSVGPTIAAKLIKKIDAKLAKKGLTAATRHTSCVNYNGGNYIRGTCQFNG